jgi:hypothetical protein
VNSSVAESGSGTVVLVEVLVDVLVDVDVDELVVVERAVVLDVFDVPDGELPAGEPPGLETATVELHAAQITAIHHHSQRINRA